MSGSQNFSSRIGSPMISSTSALVMPTRRRREFSVFFCMTPHGVNAQPPEQISSTAVPNTAAAMFSVLIFIRNPIVWFICLSRIT